MENPKFMVAFPLFLLLVAVIFEYAGVDTWWISHFHDFNDHSWPHREEWLFNDVIHSGGRRLDQIIVLIWVLTFISASLNKNARRYRKILLFFFCATISGPIVVNMLKHLTHIYTPWDLRIFGGDRPYIRLLDPVPDNAPIGHAFPAGHASGGYCLFSLYFVMLRSRSSHRFSGFLLGMALGLVFGLGQQIRGAHFPSHDLFSMVICWYAAMAVYFLFYPEEWNALKRA